jgi:predicted DNA-binding protein with PD1-like motif
VRRGVTDVSLSGGRFGAVRLMPGEDLAAGLDAIRAAMDAPAAAVVTCVGSLTRAVLRFADRVSATEVAGPLEIVSLTGTLDPAGHHLHATVSDADGGVTGGHVLPGCIVRTTAEVVLVALDDLAFGRAPCPVSGHRELTVGPAR